MRGIFQIEQQETIVLDTCRNFFIVHQIVIEYASFNKIIKAYQQTTAAIKP